MKAPIPKNEAERLKALDLYQLLDTAEEPVYDSFARLAAAIVGAPIAAIGLVDGSREWFKSRVGLEVREVPRATALCAYVVAEGRALVVPDTHEDARFKDNVLVTGQPLVRFYAGIPLTVPGGYTIGSLCVMDVRPRDLTPEQMQSLEALAQTLLSVLEARHRFRTLFDAAHMDAFAIDAASGKIAFVSRGAAQRLGYPFEDMRGKVAADVIPLLTARELQRLVRASRAGREVVCETELRRADGSSFVAELRIDVTYEQNEERVVAIALDLTERKAQEREISLLLGAMNVAGDVILVYRVNAGGQLELSYMNDAYMRQSGYTHAEAIGRSLESFRQAMPDDEGMRVVRDAIAAGTPVQAEIVTYRKDGSTFWNQVTLHPILDNANVITHWISIERDITDDVTRASTLAEEHDRLLALNRASRRLFAALDGRALVETVRDVVRELLSAHARLLAVSAQGLAIEAHELGGVGWNDAFADELIQKSVHYQMRVIDDDAERAIAYVGRFGDARYVLELRARASHRLRNTDLVLFDLVAEYFAVAARNVTLYHELDERRSAVLELSQTKSDLIAMLAHDFRGPLTTIVGFSDLATEVGELTEEQREFLDTIKRSALQLSELATDTLTLSRLERNEVALQIADVDVAALLQSVIEAQSDHRTVLFSSQGDGHVAGDEDRLRQVFSNIIDNAIKYSPDGSSPEVEVTGDADSVCVRVRDRGIGIPAGEVSRIFDRFTRASNARRMRISGTGFGLFLSKQLLQLHGGTVAVESIEGKGTTFTATLPRRVDRRATPRTIVVLDPERDRSFLAYGVREAGYRALTVGSLEEMHSVADAQPVDALILATPDDLTPAQAAQFRAFGRERKIPIVAIGNKAAPRLGASVTLSRPVLVSDVVAALGTLLGSSTL